MSAQDTSGDDVVTYDFATLCTPHYKALVNYATRLCQSREEAKDLVQEAFAKALRYWADWRPSATEDPAHAARGWLHRIVQNVFFDRVRAHNGHRKLLEDNHNSVVENTYGTETDHNIQVLSDGIGDEVHQALDALDRDQRDVVELADFGGEQYLAIADALGIPLGTVMSRLHRARKRLSGTLCDYAKNEYGISRKEISVKPIRRPKLAEGTQTRIKPAPESDGTGAAALADVPAEPPEPQTDCIDGVMAGDDSGDFVQG